MPRSSGTSCSWWLPLPDCAENEPVLLLDPILGYRVTISMLIFLGDSMTQYLEEKPCIRSNWS